MNILHRLAVAKQGKLDETNQSAFLHGHTSGDIGVVLVIPRLPFRHSHYSLYIPSLELLPALWLPSFDLLLFVFFVLLLSKCCCIKRRDMSSQQTCADSLRSEPASQPYIPLSFLQIRDRVLFFTGHFFLQQCTSSNSTNVSRLGAISLSVLMSCPCIWSIVPEHCCCCCCSCLRRTKTIRYGPA